MCPVIRIPNDLYKKLEHLAVGFDTPANVIEKLIIAQDGNEIEDGLLSGKKGDEITISIQHNLPVSEFKKIHRIKKWSKCLQQGNSQIINTYLELSENNYGIERDVFMDVLESKEVYGGDFDKIKNNLSQMKNDNGNNHGRIFYEYNNKWIMYDVVYKEALKYFNN